LKENLKVSVAPREHASQQAGKLGKRDLSLQNMIRSWSGENTEVSVNEFIREIEMVALSGKWTDADKALVCRVKVSGAAAAFISSHPRLQDMNTPFSHYSELLKERFQDLTTPEENLLALNSISQGRSERVKEFADRCRQLGERALNKKGDPSEQDWERAFMERLVLSAYIKGLRGEARKQLTYNPPANFEEAVRRSTIIEADEARREGEVDQGVFAVRRQEGTFRGVCFRCGKQGHRAADCTKDGKTSERPVESKKFQGKCYVCDRPGHMAKACRLRRAKEQDSYSAAVESTPIPQEVPKANPPAASAPTREGRS